MFAPALAKATAATLPSPLVLPVIIAVFPVKSKIFRLI
jgi:hypothetical protein